MTAAPVTILWLLVGAAPGPPISERAGAASASSATPDCAAPADTRAPDPRCDEPLDGRPPPQPAPAMAVPHLFLTFPRLVSTAVFWPVVRGGELLERHQVPNWLEAVLTSDDGAVGIRPEIEYASGFLPRGGLRFFYRRLPGGEVGARFQTAGPRANRVQLKVQLPALAVRTDWSRQDDRLFGGIGPSTSAELEAEGRSEARYGAESLTAAVDWERHLPARMVLRGHADVERHDYRSGEGGAGPPVATIYGLPPESCAGLGLATPCLDPQALPGFTRGLRIGHLGAALTLDARSHDRDGGGISLGAAATYGHGISGDPSRHLLLSAGTVMALGGRDRVLLAYARAATVERLASAPVPFEELVMPERTAEMRGFPAGRFRGDSGLFGGMEYRWLIAFNLDAALFVDVGTVAGSRFAQLRMDRLFPTYGLGVRYFPNKAPRYWQALPDAGVQLTYAPDAGLRVMLSLAPY